MKKFLAFVLILFFSVNSYSQTRGMYDDRLLFGHGGGISVFLAVGSSFLGDLGIDSEDVYLRDIVDDFQYTQGYIPSFSLGVEYDPYKTVSLDASLSYLRHGISSAQVDEEIQQAGEGNLDFDFNSNKILFLVGGNLHYDNTRFFSPYLTTGVGLSFNQYTQVVDGVLEDGLECEADPSANAPCRLRLTTSSGWGVAPAAQAGAGVMFDVGPIDLSLEYNYLISNGHGSSGDETVELYFVTENGEKVIQDDVSTLDDLNFDEFSGHRLELKASLPVGR